MEAANTEYQKYQESLLCDSHYDIENAYYNYQKTIIKKCYN